MIIFILGEKIKKFSHLDFENPPNDSASITLGITELKKIQNSVVNQKPFLEIFAYDDFSLWWFFYPEISNRFIKIINFIKNFSESVEQTKPNKIRLESQFEYFEIVKQIAIENNIKLEHSSAKLLIHKITKKISFVLRKYKAKKITHQKIQRRKNLFYKKNLVIPKVDNKIVCMSYPVYRRLGWDFVKETFTKNEFLINELQHLLGRNEEIIGIDSFSLISSPDDILSERLNSEMKWFPIEALMQDLKISERQKDFIKKFEKMMENTEFQELFQFKNTSYWPQISEQFKKLTLEYNLPYWFSLLKSLQKFLLEHKPRVFLLLYETGPKSLAIINVCRKLGIKTIGVQHGIIHDTHPYYMHDKFADSKNSFGFPLPDRLLLFGEITKKILLNHGYPEEKLTVFCNPVFLPLNKIKFKQKSIIEKYHLPINKKFILFAPPGMKDYTESKINYNEEIIKKLLQTFMDNKEIFFLIKPHPADDPNDYKKILDKFGSTNAKIIDGSLIELITISELVVSTFSTTIIDSMCLKKAVIQVTFSGINYDRPYDEFNAVLQASLSELSKKILYLLNDESKKLELIKNGHNFAKQYYNFPYKQPIENLKQILLPK